MHACPFPLAALSHSEGIEGGSEGTRRRIEAKGEGTPSAEARRKRHGQRRYSDATPQGWVAFRHPAGSPRLLISAVHEPGWRIQKGFSQGLLYYLTVLTVISLRCWQPV